MACWDGFGPPDPDEIRGWEDSDDGDLPWAPHHVDDPEPWQARDWTGTPEERMHREMLDEDDGDGS